MSTLIVNGLMIRANGSSRVIVNGWQGGSSLKKRAKQNLAAPPHNEEGQAQTVAIMKALVLSSEMANVPRQLYMTDVGTMVPTAGFQNWEEKFAFFPVCVGIENGINRHIRFQKYEVVKIGAWDNYFILTRERGSDSAYCTHDVAW